MTDLHKAAQQALEALCECGPQQRKAKTALRAALAEPAPEPVATLHDDGCFTWKRDEFRLKFDRQQAGWRMDVFAAPPQQPAPEPVADHFPDAGKMVQGQVAWTDRERRVVRFALKWFISGALQRHAAAAADLRGMWFKPGDDLKFYQDAEDANSALAKMGAAEPLGAPGGGHSAASSLDNHSPQR